MKLPNFNELLPAINAKMTALENEGAEVQGRAQAIAQQKQILSHLKILAEGVTRLGPASLSFDLQFENKTTGREWVAFIKLEKSNGISLRGTGATPGAAVDDLWAKTVAVVEQ